MNTKAVFVWLAALMLSLGCDLAVARDGGSFGGNFHGNGGSFHGNAGAVHGNAGSFQGHQHFENHRGGMHMSGRFHDGRFHDFHGHSRIIIGGPFFWSPFYYGAPVYPDNSQLIYVPPRGEDYSYYCRDPVGYYPDIQRCPSGWLQVAPDDIPD